MDFDEARKFYSELLEESRKHRLYLEEGEKRVIQIITIIVTLVAGAFAFLGIKSISSVSSEITLQMAIATNKVADLQYKVALVLTNLDAEVGTRLQSLVTNDLVISKSRSLAQSQIERDRRASTVARLLARELPGVLARSNEEELQLTQFQLTRTELEALTECLREPGTPEFLQALEFLMVRKRNLVTTDRVWKDIEPAYRYDAANSILQAVNTLTNNHVLFSPPALTRLLDGAAAVGGSGMAKALERIYQTQTVREDLRFYALSRLAEIGRTDEAGPEVLSFFKQIWDGDVCAKAYWELYHFIQASSELAARDFEHYNLSAEGFGAAVFSQCLASSTENCRIAALRLLADFLGRVFDSDHKDKLAEIIVTSSFYSAVANPRHGLSLKPVPAEGHKILNEFSVTEKDTRFDYALARATKETLITNYSPQTRERVVNSFLRPLTIYFNFPAHNLDFYYKELKLGGSIRYPHGFWINPARPTVRLKSKATAIDKDTTPDAPLLLIGLTNGIATIALPWPPGRIASLAATNQDYEEWEVPLIPFRWADEYTVRADDLDWASLEFSQGKPTKR